MKVAYWTDTALLIDSSAFQTVAMPKNFESETQYQRYSANIIWWNALLLHLYLQSHFCLLVGWKPHQWPMGNLLRNRSQKGLPPIHMFIALREELDRVLWLFHLLDLFSFEFKYCADADRLKFCTAAPPEEAFMTEWGDTWHVLHQR